MNENSNPNNSNKEE